MSDHENYFKALASEVLEQFNVVATAAQMKYDSGSKGLSLDNMANVNSFNDPGAGILLEKIRKANEADFLTLTREPFVARVKALDVEKKKVVAYYFCRASAGIGVNDLVSHNVPFAHIATLKPGAPFRLPNGRELLVLENSRFVPRRDRTGWDSIDTSTATEEIGPFTLKSLRSLLYQLTHEVLTEDHLKRIMDEARIRGDLLEGRRRNVINKMGLRDQPILDQYQDDIFRLPLDNRLLILGPPGTGKTTTLIRRLGQKLDILALEPNERLIVSEREKTVSRSHKDSWLMFTPTSLLQQYLKQAFAREGVPAPDARIKTWSSYQVSLARGSFGILKSAAGRGLFVLNSAALILKQETIRSSIQWYLDFLAWQQARYREDLDEAALRLMDVNDEEIRSLGNRLAALIDRNRQKDIPTLLEGIAGSVHVLQSRITGLKADSDEKTSRFINLQMNVNKTFLDDLVMFLEAQRTNISSDAEDLDEADTEDEDGLAVVSLTKDFAATVCMAALRTKARNTVLGRRTTRTTRAGKIIEWLGERTLSEAEEKVLGASLLLQRAARTFVNPVKRYFDGMTNRYRDFRRHRQKEGIWYNDGGFETKYIHPLELDLLLLAILREGNLFLARPHNQSNLGETGWGAPQTIYGLQNDQILVDEATDFSPLQLACMGALATPRMNSFFACGDFNQRLTTWGARSLEEMRWIFPDLDVREITVAYRQSRQLNELAKALCTTLRGTANTATLPEDVDNEGVSPTLLEGAQDEDVAEWLALRIREIDYFVKKVPSTAIFVNSEAKVQPLARMLNERLAMDNLHVVGCFEGQYVGEEDQVRVFDIQHIKGLEFEAVFFIGVDQLAEMHPELFDRFLYVGMTRAATYLGITCEGSLPEALEPLRTHFTKAWGP